MNVFSVLLAAMLVLAPFPREALGADLRVLTSFLPMYLFTRNVVGDAPGVAVEMMLPASLGCPHDYSLSPGDMKKIAEADLFLANGFGMEEFLHGGFISLGGPGFQFLPAGAKSGAAHEMGH